MPLHQQDTLMPPLEAACVGRAQVNPGSAEERSEMRKPVLGLSPSPCCVSLSELGGFGWDKNSPVQPFFLLSLPLNTHRFQCNPLMLGTLAPRYKSLFQ